MAIAASAALPVVYEENAGQAAGDALFLARARGYTIALGKQAATIRAHGIQVRLELDPARIEALEPAPGVTHYLAGPRERWRAGVRGYRRIRYRGIAPGVDLVFQGERGRVNWEYVLSPGARPGGVEVRFTGAAVSVDTSGGLRIGGPSGVLRLGRPAAYQDLPQGRRWTAAHYECLAGGRVRIEAEWPDRSMPLVIDPELSAVRTLGGSGADAVYGLAVDSHGAAYLAGETRSVDFPNASGPAPSGANTQILVVKLRPGGDPEYTVLVGGTGDDAAYAIAVDGRGAVHLTGRTSSLDFPVTRGALQAAKGGSWDAFYMRLAPGGGGVEAATYIGGEEIDSGRAITLDANGSVYIGGSTSSAKFPARVGKRRGAWDGFVLKLDAKSGRALYSTLVGGAGEDHVNAIAVDERGSAWVAGQTNSADFPVTASAVQRVKHGLWDAFVLQLDPAGARPRYATFLGGGPSAGSRGMDEARAIALDTSGGVWVAGETDAADFPGTRGAPAPAGSRRRRGFLAHLDTSRGASLTATYLGGGGDAAVNAVTAGPDGSVAVAGTTWSSDFPPPPDVAISGPGGGADAFAQVFRAGRLAPTCAARLGGTGEELGRAVAIDPSGWIWIAAVSASSDFGNAAQNGDIFAARFRCSR